VKPDDIMQVPSAPRPAGPPAETDPPWTDPEPGRIAGPAGVMGGTGEPEPGPRGADPAVRESGAQRHDHASPQGRTQVNTQ